MRRYLAIGAVALVALLTIAVGLAGAGSYTTDFESFTLGTVDGQNGWHSAVPGDIPALPNGYDQSIVDNTYAGFPAAGFGNQALRVSNAYTEPSGEFFFQTYSPSVADPAGESATNKVFDGSFQFYDPSYQPDLFVSVSPDNGVGARMSYVSLEDTAAGVHMTFYDTSGDPNVNQGFVGYDAGTYSHGAVHTVEFKIQVVDGPSNDVVRLIIDNTDIGDSLDACFTTWEQYYRNWDPNPDNTVGHEPGVINSFEFRTAGDGTTISSLIGQGYLFDNVSTDARNTDGPAPTNCGVPEVGLIAPTGTTCDQYRDGTAPTLDQVQYTISKDVIGSVSPGVFFYYTKVSGDENQEVDVIQTNDFSPLYAIPIQKDQAFLYDASTCTKLKWDFNTTTSVGKLPSTGDFILGVKYNPSALKGEAPPVPDTITYAFETELEGTLVDTGATIDLAPKFP